MELEGGFFDTSEFELTKKKLGEGAFGKVYIVKSLKDQKEYAAKIIDSESLLKGKDQMNLIRESEILHKLHHPAIVKYYGINFHSFDDSSKLEPTILTEYLPNKSLKEILDKEKKSIANKNWTPTKKYICLLGIADAMRYLHEQQIIHRDIKPQNVLIDSQFYPRVCDFGLSRCFSEAYSKSMKLSMTGNVGTPLYMAPELYEDDDVSHYGPSVDVYAFAMIAYEIVTGLEPFSENGKPISMLKLSRKLSNGARPEFNKGVTTKMKNLISKCWNDDPKKRPSFKEIFDELSSDMSFFDEDVDEEEVTNYIEDLKESRKQEKKDDKQLFKSTNSSNNIILSDLLIDITTIEIKEKIGEGSFAEVYLAALDNQAKTTTCAAKLFHNRTFRGLKQFYNELQIQASLKHEAILPLIGFSEQTKEFQQMTLLPYMENGSLRNMIEKCQQGRSPRKWDETAKAITIFGIAAGMAYIHQHDIIFRDLKPDNILLDEFYHPKISDFIVAKRVNHGESFDANNEMAGTPFYMAPETFEGSKKITNKIDVYSYSIVLYELLSYQFPYPTSSRMFQLIHNVSKGLRPEIRRGEIPDIFVKLIKRCWDGDPNNRPSFIEIVKDFLDHKDEYFDFDLIEEDAFEDYVETVIEGLNLD